LPDGPGVYAEWKRLVKDHRVQGVKVYDARLVAVANIYAVGSILTFNTADFKRYRTINVLDPRWFRSHCFPTMLSACQIAHRTK